MQQCSRLWPTLGRLIARPSRQRFGQCCVRGCREKGVRRGCSVVKVLQRRFACSVYPPQCLRLRTPRRLPYRLVGRGSLRARHRGCAQSLRKQRAAAAGEQLRAKLRQGGRTQRVSAWRLRGKCLGDARAARRPPLRPSRRRSGCCQQRCGNTASSGGRHSSSGALRV